jgi:hypothetical protein
MLLMGLQELRLPRGVGEKVSNCGITIVIIAGRHKFQRQ